MQTGAQQVHGRGGAGHGAQVVVQVLVGAVSSEGKSGYNMENRGHFKFKREFKSSLNTIFKLVCRCMCLKVHKTTVKP